MKSRMKITGLAIAAVLCLSAHGFAQERAGVVRISDKAAVGREMKAQSRNAGIPVSYEHASQSGSCTNGQCTTGECSDGQGCQNCQDCDECQGIPCPFCLLGLPCLHQCYLHPSNPANPSNNHCPPGVECFYNEDGKQCYYNANGELICDDGHGWKSFAKKAACRYGYFRPQGNCGKGLAPIGQYKTVYALNPDYFDPRDGRLYAAQGYGVNVSVPLAPTVGSVYNYGWGIPSSRQTYVSHRVPLAIPQQQAVPVQPTPAP